MTDLRLLSLLLAALLCSAASARDISQNEVLELRRSGALLPFEQLLKSIETRYPGARILEVELDEDDGIYLYEIEILTGDDRVRELEVDASNGTILTDELED